MVISIDSLKEPVGSIKPWIRPNTSTPLPVNWLICDGSTVADSASPFNTLAIPDFRSRFVRGHNLLTNANFGSDTNYFTGGTIPSGGADSNNLSHQHAEGSHNHSIGSDGASHTHSISNDAHTHNSDNVVTPGHNLIAGPSGTFTDNHNHSHGGATGSGSSNHSHGGNTGSNNGSGTDFRLGVTENRPVFTEYLHIIKIK